jgi:hypothetical protein
LAQGVARVLRPEQKLREAGEKTLLLVQRDEASFFTAVKRSEDGWQGIHPTGSWR